MIACWWYRARCPEHGPIRMRSPLNSNSGEGYCPFNCCKRIQWELIAYGYTNDSKIEIERVVDVDLDSLPDSKRPKDKVFKHV